MPRRQPTARATGRCLQPPRLRENVMGYAVVNR